MLGNRHVGLIAFLVLTVLSAAAVAGWSIHGEAIFLRFAETTWATCF